MTLINKPEELRWLRQTHLPLGTPAFRSAIIDGNEDCPDKVTLYANADPNVTDRPVATYRSEDGDLRRVRNPKADRVLVQDRGRGTYRWSGTNPDHVDLWTVFIKDAHCGRGEYAEELDVLAHTMAGARKVAEAALARDYEPGVRVARIVKRVKGTMFM
jgi:hypothetical protein